MADPITRRRFLTIAGATGTGLIVGVSLAGCEERSQPTTSTSPSNSAPPRVGSDTNPALSAGTLAPTIFLAIGSDGVTTITSFRSEMGQGIRTATAMILAEELDADWNAVVVEQAPADPAFGNQVTGGSQSVSGSYRRLRQAGATTRWLLVEAAARVWNVPHDSCWTEPGVVVHPDGEHRLTYGELAGNASDLEAPSPDEVPLKDEAAFRIIGTDVHHIDGRDIVTGTAVYGFDIRVPDMVYAVIARRPTFEGSLRGFDDSAARAAHGVLDVFALDTGVVVVATSTWAALEGRRALIVDWDDGDTAALSSNTIWADLDRRQTDSPGAGEIEATYRIPYQPHMTMEPMNCVADVRQGSCEVWAPTQDPQRVRRSAASRLGLPVESVLVHVTRMGGGFGRRLADDYAVEAVRISQRVGRPVQVVWSREDDTRHDLYHPLSYQYVRGTPAVDTRPRVRSLAPIDYVPTGAWRSVGEHAPAFAVQSFIDEMAHALGMDPLDYRRARHSGRALATIDLAAEKAGWGEPLANGWGRGIAHHALFGVTDVAMVALVEVEAERVRVHRMTAAVDCGLVVNPTTVAAQIEGGIAFALTAALKGGVTLDSGRIVEGNLHEAPLLSLKEMPEVDVHLVQSDDAPSGVGEAGVPPVAPSVANAVFAATGERIRALPIRVSA